MGAIGTRLSLRPLFKTGRNEEQSSDKSCRENAEVCHRRRHTFSVVPAKAGTHNHRWSLLSSAATTSPLHNSRREVWVPAFAGTTAEDAPSRLKHDRLWNTGSPAFAFACDDTHVFVIMNRGPSTAVVLAPRAQLRARPGRRLRRSSARVRHRHAEEAAQRPSRSSKRDGGCGANAPLSIQPVHRLMSRECERVAYTPMLTRSLQPVPVGRAPRRIDDG